MSAAPYALMDSAQLLRHADIDSNPLTQTELERVLANSMRALVDDIRRQAKLVAIYEDHDLELCYEEDLEKLTAALDFAQRNDDLTAVNDLLKALGDHDIDTPDELNKRMAQLRSFETLCNDVGDYATREDLITALSLINQE